MVGIAFDLSGPAQMTFHEQTHAGAAQGHCRGIEQRFAGHSFFRCADVRHNVFARHRPDGAAAESTQGQRRAHQRQELPPAEGIGPNRRLLRKLAEHQRLEVLGVGQFFEAAPIALTLRRAGWLRKVSRAELKSILRFIDGRPNSW